MEVIIAFATLYFLWKVLSKLAPKKRKPAPRRRTSNSFSPNFNGDGGPYSSVRSGRAPYSPISKSSSGIPIKSDAGYIGPFRQSNRRKSDFNYSENPNPQEFLVYFIASEDLGALKIGVGTSGRVLQLLNSTIRSEDGFENVGWKVLRTAAFSTGPYDFEIGRDFAYEAERRVLFYWRKHLKLPVRVSERDMGWAELDYLGARGFHLTKGYTETVDLLSVCEETSWNIVKQSPGYLGDGSSFYSHRGLIARKDVGLSTSTPPGYSQYKESLKRSAGNSNLTVNSDLASSDIDPAERKSHKSISLVPKSPSIRKNKKMPKSDGTKDGKFWVRVDKKPNGCWMWLGSISTDSGYAQMLWEGSSRPAHRIAWQLEHGEMPAGDFLMNACGARTCVNPDHWELKKLEERKCITPNCDGISLKKMVDGYCESCERRRRYAYRKSRPNPYICINPNCNSPSGTVAFASLCMACRRRDAKNRK